MARTITAGALNTLIRQRIEFDTDDFVTEAEMLSYIDDSNTELHDYLVKADPRRYQKRETFTLTSSSNLHTLPADYYGTLELMVEWGSTQKYTKVEPIQTGELHRWESREATSYDRVFRNEYSGYGYQFIDTGVASGMEILPAPSSSTDFIHYYIKVPGTISSTSDTIDGISGWEEFIVLDCAIKCLAKEMSDTNHFERRLMEMKDRLVTMAENRSAGEASHVVDVGHHGPFSGLADWEWGI